MCVCMLMVLLVLHKMLNKYSFKFIKNKIYFIESVLLHKFFFMYGMVVKWKKNKFVLLIFPPTTTNLYTSNCIKLNWKNKKNHLFVFFFILLLKHSVKWMLIIFIYFEAIGMLVFLFQYYYIMRGVFFLNQGKYFISIFTYFIFLSILCVYV